jgi:hypothetical protein
MEVFILLGLAALAFALQIFATVRVRTSPSYAADQKTAQFKLIWLLPVLGAAMVLVVMHQDGELISRDRTTQQGPRG